MLTTTYYVSLCPCKQILVVFGATSKSYYSIYVYKAYDAANFNNHHLAIY